MTLLVIAGLGLLSAWNCADPVSPMPSHVATRPRLDLESPPPTASITLPTLTTATRVGDAPLQFLASGRPGWDVLLHVSGSIHSNVRGVRYPYLGDPARELVQKCDVFNEWDTDVIGVSTSGTTTVQPWGGEMKVIYHLTYRTTSAYYGENAASSSWQSDGSGGRALIIPDPGAYDISVRRQGFERSYCQETDETARTTAVYDPNRIMSGNHSVEARFVKLAVQASRTSYAPGTQIRFTAQTLNIAGTAPVWAFRVSEPGPGGFPVRIEIPSCAGQWICDYEPTTTGVVEATSSVDYDLQLVGISDTVKALKCLTTDDTLLNNPDFRAVLLQGLDSSGKYDRATDKFRTVDSARREVAGIVTMNKTTRSLSFRPVTLTTSSPCSFNGGFSYPTTDTLIAMWHTHPFRPGGRWAPGERLPLNCGRGPNVAYDSRMSSDADDTDWPQAAKLRTPYYAIDAKYVIVAPGDNPLAVDRKKWRSLERRHDWNTDKCRW